jgi:hypothetical protein
LKTSRTLDIAINSIIHHNKAITNLNIDFLTKKIGLYYYYDLIVCDQMINQLISSNKEFMSAIKGLNISRSSGESLITNLYITVGDNSEVKDKVDIILKKAKEAERLVNDRYIQIRAERIALIDDSEGRLLLQDSQAADR